MGMYTELNIGVNFSPFTPNNIIKILDYMLGNNGDNNIELTSHPLFSTERWRYMLRCDSYYFDGRTDSSMEYDDIGNNYQLNVRCNLKNYNNEISLFLDFIQPYLNTYGFLGYTRYEEHEDPTLIYNTRKGIKLLNVYELRE